MGQQTLEDFALKSLDHGRLTGVSLAIHAIPDAFLLLHSGVGCKHKATTQLATHDLARSPVSREAWTEVGDAELIQGASDRVGPYIRAWSARMSPAFMAVCTVTFLDLTGEDLAWEIEKAAKTVDGRVKLIPAAGFDGDLWAGWATAVRSVLEEVDWKVEQDPQRVSLLGHFFDRYEGDATGNVERIRSLLSGIGLRLGPVLLSGQPYGELLEAGRSGVLVQMPHLRPIAKRMKRLVKKRDRVETDLPVGIRGTTRWVRQVAEAAGVAEATVEPFLARRAAVTRKALGRFGALQGQRVAVFADLPLLAGTVSALDELGVRPVLLGIRGHSLGGSDVLSQTLARDGVDLPDDCLVLEHPSIARVRDEVGRLLHDGAIDGVLGAATDLTALAAAGHQPTFALEIGFPCKDHHVTGTMPWMGFGGMLTWAARLQGAPRLWRTDRGR